MEFNVDGAVKTIVARAYQAGTASENMPEQTEAIFADYLAGHKRDFLRKHYKITEAEYQEMTTIAAQIDANNALRAALNAEQQEKYDDWDMTRCVNSIDIMTKKEYDFLTELTAQ